MPLPPRPQVTAPIDPKPTPEPEPIDTRSSLSHTEPVTANTAGYDPGPYEYVPWLPDNRQPAEGAPWGYSARGLPYRTRKHRNPKHAYNASPAILKKQARERGDLAPNDGTMQNWKHRHTLILYMHVAGQRTKDIAAALGMNEGSVGVVVRSPLFQTQKDQLLQELKTATIEDVIELIRRDAPENLKFLIEMRSSGEDDKVRLGAARVLSHEADRVWPRRTEHKEERVLRLAIDHESLQKIAAAFQDLGDPIDVTPIQLAQSSEELSTMPAPAKIIPKSIQQLMKEAVESVRGSSDDAFNQ